MRPEVKFKNNWYKKGRKDELHEKLVIATGAVNRKRKPISVQKLDFIQKIETGQK